MRQRNVTIADVAREASVSKATVSRVMASRGSVSPELAARVRAVAAALGYQPSPVARGLATGKTQMVGVLVPQLSNPYFHEVIKAIGGGAAQDGYRMLILESDDRPDDEPTLARYLYRHADGVVLCSPRMSDEDLRQLCTDRPHLLCVNRIPAGIGVVALAYDTYSPMLHICGMLNRLGHQRAVHLAGPSDSWISRERWRAVEHAAAFGLQASRVQAGFTIDEGYQAIDAALEFRPTALIAANDLCAIGALTRLRELGLRVPQDMSLTGFDDIPFSQHVVPPLTTARVPRHELGRRAWEVMHSLLAGESVPAAQPLMPTEVLLRASTGPPPTDRGVRKGRS